MNMSTFYSLEQAIECEEKFQRVSAERDDLVLWKRSVEGHVIKFLSGLERTA